MHQNLRTHRGFPDKLLIRSNTENVVLVVIPIDGGQSLLTALG